jgi:hypothetical protein
MLDFPHEVDAEPVGQLDLIERVAERALFGIRVPRARDLVLVEQPESQLESPPLRRE